MARSPKSVHDRVIDAALELAAEKAWRQISLNEIAKAARLTLGELNENFGSKTAIVGAVMAKTNASVLKGIDPSAENEPIHDRLLDALLSRLDALQPHKPAICSILRDLRADPLSLGCLVPGYFNAMAWTLEAAGIGSGGPGGRLKVKGLGAIYLGALCVWSRDDSSDQGKTLAYLDRRLRQAEKLAKFVPDGSAARRRHRTADEEPEKSG